MSNETTPTATAAGEKPSMVIIGGLGMYLVSAIAPNVPVVLEHFYTTHLLTHNAGYVGRFLALYIHNKNLSSDLRLVDKQLPIFHRNSRKPALAPASCKPMQAARLTCSASSIDLMVNHSTTSSIAAAKRAIRKRTRCTEFDHMPCPCVSAQKRRNEASSAT